MKLKFTSLLLASILCMAGAVSCGKVESNTDGDVKIEIEDSTAETTTEDTSGTTASTSAESKDGTTTAASSTTTENTEATTASDTEKKSDDEKKDDSDNNSGDNNSSAPQEQKTEAPQQNETPTEAPQQQAEDVEFSIDDLLNDAAPLLEKLGAYEYDSISPACTSNGCDVRTYTYKDVEIQAYIDGSTEYIFKIVITGSGYKTSKGIEIGNSRADVEAAYGTPIDGGSCMVYEDADFKEMDVTYNGDILSSITFYVPV